MVWPPILYGISEINNNLNPLQASNCYDIKAFAYYPPATKSNMEICLQDFLEIWNYFSLHFVYYDEINVLNHTLPVFRGWSGQDVCG